MCKLCLTLLCILYEAWRMQELTNMAVSGMDEWVFLTISKTKTFKKLCLPLLMMKLSLPYSFWKIYITLRPRNVRHYCRFFLQYRKYACTIQPVRKNLFGSISKTKATLLQLPIPERYEGQPARRPWVTLLMKVTLPPSNGMDDVAEGYVKDSIEKKTKKMV